MSYFSLPFLCCILFDHTTLLYGIDFGKTTFYSAIFHSIT